MLWVGQEEALKDQDPARKGPHLLVKLDDDHENLSLCVDLTRNNRLANSGTWKVRKSTTFKKFNKEVSLLPSIGVKVSKRVSWEMTACMRRKTMVKENAISRHNSKQETTMKYAFLAENSISAIRRRWPNNIKYQHDPFFCGKWTYNALIIVWYSLNYLI